MVETFLSDCVLPDRAADWIRLIQLRSSLPEPRTARGYSAPAMRLSTCCLIAVQRHRRTVLMPISEIGRRIVPEIRLRMPFRLTNGIQLVLRDGMRTPDSHPERELAAASARQSAAEISRRRQKEAHPGGESASLARVGDSICCGTGFRLRRSPRQPGQRTCAGCGLPVCAGGGSWCCRTWCRCRRSER